MPIEMKELPVGENPYIFVSHKYGNAWKAVHNAMGVGKEKKGKRNESTNPTE